MTAAACVAAHRVDPARPRPALGGLLLCAGHYDGLVEALTGPSAAVDPAVEAVWGYRQGYQVVICADRERATIQLDAALREYTDRQLRQFTAAPVPPTAILPGGPPPGPLLCGDGETWHNPDHYRPGGIARDYAALTQRLLGQRTADTAPYVTGSAEPRLPAPDAVAQLRSDTRHVLLSWATVHAELQRIAPPADGASVHQLVDYLARYRDWSAAHPDIAGAYTDELLTLRARARTLIDLPQPPRTTIAPCIEQRDGQRCPGTLTATPREDGDPRPSVIACDTCDATYPSERWLRLGDRLATHARRTAA